MRRFWLPALMLLAIASTVRAVEQTVSFKSGTETASGVLVTPGGKGPFPGIVVIQEWWGLNDWVKDRARALAKEGYVALAVDLYRGKVTAKEEEAHQLMMGLPPDRAMRDLKAAFAHLQGRADVKKDRIGAIGWCLGGRYTLALAVEEPTLAAAVAYYGAPPTDEAAIAKIKAPVLGNFGAEDKGPSPEQVKAFEAAMKKAGKVVDIKIYEGAGHAFANVNNPWGGYREPAAKDAWARTSAFLAKHLSDAFSAGSSAAATQPQSGMDPARQVQGTAGPGTAAGGGSLSRGRCQPTLAYLGAVLEAIPEDSDLVNLRQTILATKVADAITQVRAANMSLAEAARLLVEQSGRYSDGMEQSLQCVRQTAAAGVEDRIVEDLQRRAYSVRNIDGHSIRDVVTEGNMLSACVKAYILSDWGQYSMKEIAVQTVCMANSGN